MTTVANAFDPRKNSLNAIRLALATLVIVSHSWSLGGYGDDPGFGDQDLGDWAVAGFFTISGYLITASRMASVSFFDYMWRRFLRIYPAFFVSLLVVAFIIAPASAILTRAGGYNWSSSVGFVIKNSAVLMRQWGIDGTLEAVPFVTTWNGSAWTLFYELLCYIGVGVALSFIAARAVKPAIVAVFFACLVLTTVTHTFGISLPSIMELTARLGGFFAAGAIVFIFREKISLNKGGAILSIIALVSIVAISHFQVLAGLPVAYLMVYLGTRLPFTRVAARNDVSYGMYIYAFPVQQLLATVYPHQQLQLTLFIAASIALTVPLAWASWILVEKPAMRFKHLLKKQVGADI